MTGIGPSNVPGNIVKNIIARFIYVENINTNDLAVLFPPFHVHLQNTGRGDFMKAAKHRHLMKQDDRDESFNEVESVTGVGPGMLRLLQQLSALSQFLRLEKIIEQSCNKSQLMSNLHYSNKDQKQRKDNSEEAFEAKQKADVQHDF